ncbi:unnamed protein product, partial [Polarella glacialis]
PGLAPETPESASSCFRSSRESVGTTRLSSGSSASSGAVSDASSFASESRLVRAEAEVAAVRAVAAAVIAAEIRLRYEAEAHAAQLAATSSSCSNCSRKVPKNEPPASYSVPTAPPVQDGEVVQSSTRGRSVCSEVSRCPQLHGDPSQRPNATGEELRHHAVKLEAWINAGRPNQSRSGSASVGVRAPSASGQSSVGAPGALGPSLSRGTGAMGSGASIGRATTRQRSIGRSKSGLASAALAAFTARGSSGATLSSLRHSSALKFAPSQRSNRRVAAQRADRTPERKCLSFAD